MEPSIRHPGGVWDSVSKPGRLRALDTSGAFVQEKVRLGDLHLLKNICLFSLVGFKGNPSLLRKCFLFFLGLNQMEGEGPAEGRGEEGPTRTGAKSSPRVAGRLPPQLRASAAQRRTRGALFWVSEPFALGFLVCRWGAHFAFLLIVV